MPSEAVIDASEGNQETEQQSFEHRPSISFFEAQHNLANWIQNIETDYRYLQDICASHGDIIMNRWKKKTQVKRGEFLLNVVPAMYPEKWAVPRRLFIDEKNSTRERQKFSMAYLLPYINVEDLKSDPARLLCLLLHRTRYPYQKWASFDTKTLLPGWDSGAFEVDFNENYVVMYGEQYGQLTPWDKKSVERQDTLEYPLASLTLAAQSKLMSFLRTCVELLLEGVDTSQARTADKWNEMSEKGFKFTNSVEYPSPYLNQAFSAPPVFDIEEIQSSVTSKVRVLADSIQDMQTDPGYLRRMVRTIQASEINKKSTGNAHVFCAREIFGYFDTLQNWKFLQEEVHQVSETMSKFWGDIKQGAPLPLEVNNGLAALEVVIERLLEGSLQKLKTSHAQVPGFAKYFEPGINGGEYVPSEKLESLTRLDLLDQDPLHWAFTELLYPPFGGVQVDKGTVFAILHEHLRTSELKEREKLSERLYEKISNAAELYEILHSLQLFRPMRTKRTISELVDNSNTAFWRHTNKYDEAARNGKQKRFSALFSLKCISLGEDLGDFMNVPLPPQGKPNSKWLESFDKQWSKMSEFCKSLAMIRRKYYENFEISSDDIAESMGIFLDDTAPEYVNAFQKERQRLLDRIARTAVPATSTNPAFSSEPSIEPAKSTIEAPRRVKPKTRGVKTTTNGENEVETGEPDIAEAERVQILLKTEHSYNIFKAMFKCPDSGVKMVQWHHFVIAMAEADFIATQGPGSAVKFEADGNAQTHWKGSITFHEPHPGHEIDPDLLRTMGRRMERWFGWSEDMFELKAR